MDGMIFVGQTAVTFTATLGVDITGATCKIKYKKPDYSTGEFLATITDAAAGIIEYEVASADDLNQKGDWIFWGYATFSNGKVAAGERYKIYVHQEGQQKQI